MNLLPAAIILIEPCCDHCGSKNVRFRRGKSEPEQNLPAHRSSDTYRYYTCQAVGCGKMTVIRLVSQQVIPREKKQSDKQKQAAG